MLQFVRPQYLLHGKQVPATGARLLSGYASCQSIYTIYSLGFLLWTCNKCCWHWIIRYYRQCNPPYCFHVFISVLKDYNPQSWVQRQKCCLACLKKVYDPVQCAGCSVQIFLPSSSACLQYKNHSTILNREGLNLDWLFNVTVVSHTEHKEEK